MRPRAARDQQAHSAHNGPGRSRVPHPSIYPEQGIADVRTVLQFRRARIIYPTAPMAQFAQLSDTTLMYNRVSNPLSHREREFLVRVCNPEEHTYKEIAEHMQVHRRTLDGYRVAIFNKFGIRSKVGLVLLAVKCGLVKIQ